MRRLLRSQELDAFEFTEDMGCHTAVIPYWFLDATSNGRVVAHANKTCIVRGSEFIPIPDHSWVFLLNGEISFVDRWTLDLLTYPVQQR